MTSTRTQCAGASARAMRVASHRRPPNTHPACPRSVGGRTGSMIRTGDGGEVRAGSATRVREVANAGEFAAKQPEMMRPSVADECASLACACALPAAADSRHARVRAAMGEMARYLARRGSATARPLCVTGRLAGALLLRPRSRCRAAARCDSLWTQHRVCARSHAGTMHCAAGNVTRRGLQPPRWTRRTRGSDRRRHRRAARWAAPASAPHHCCLADAFRAGERRRRVSARRDVM
jgi:hypothetical protein